MRRHAISHDDWARPQYGTRNMMQQTPRKWTTFQAPTSGNTYRYQTGDRVAGPSDGYTPNPGNYSEQTAVRDPRLLQFLGRQFIFWNGNDVTDYMRAVDVLKAAGRFEESPYARYAHEYEITRELRGNVFRVIWVRDGLIVSKLAVEYRPGQVNLLIDAETMIILEINRG